MAILNARALNKYCVEMSDDIVKLEFALNKKDKAPISFKSVVKSMVSTLEEFDLHLAGVAPTNNPYFYNPNKPIQTDKFIVGDLICVSPNTDLLFDENLKLKEDYDYTLQHLHKYSGIVRLDYILASFKHYTNKGGAVDFRNEEREQTAIKYLKEKWQTDVRDNTKRPNEILLKWCKRSSH
jgi:hypothetical protein